MVVTGQVVKVVKTISVVVVKTTGVDVYTTGGDGTELVPACWGEPKVVGAGGNGTTGLDGLGAGAVVPCSIWLGVEVFSAQRVQVVIVLVIKLVFTMIEVLPLITVVEVTGQLVRVV